MSCSSKMGSIALLASASILLGASSPTLAQTPTASLFICDVPASTGGCVNGTNSPAGVVTFNFNGFYDSFVSGSPAMSPAQVSETGDPIPFSFFWNTGSTPGTDTPEQTIFFTGPNGLVSDVLDYASFVTGGAGRDFMDISGYVLSLQTPLTVAELQSQGITATGSASVNGPFDFSTTALTATFQPGAVPELPTWGLMLLGFAGLGFAGSFASRRKLRLRQSARAAD